MWMSRQHPSQQDHGPFYASDATLSFTTNREEPTNPLTVVGEIPNLRLRGVVTD